MNVNEPLEPSEMLVMVRAFNTGMAAKAREALDALVGNDPRADAYAQIVKDCERVAQDAKHTLSLINS